MNKLLHSKTFRQNLFKWVFMYIAALGLLTSVITYSKYITNMMSTGEARASKFAVTIEPYNDESFKCPPDSPKNCVTNIQVRPTKEIEVYFKIDLNDLEVKTNVVLRASAGTLKGNFVQDNGAIPSQFDILRIEEVDKDRNPITDENGNVILKTEEDYNNNKITQEIITTGYEDLVGMQKATASFVFTPKPLTKRSPSDPAYVADDPSTHYVPRTDEEKEANIKYIKVVAKYRFSDSEKTEDNEVNFSSQDKQDEIRIGYSATQVN